MKILIVNPIIYTSEKSPVKKVKSIKDSMIYNLSLAFKKCGHEVVLVAADDYMPIEKEDYDVNIIFLKTRFKKIFKPNCIPLLCGLKKYLKRNKFDMIISSEVFSINSLYLSIKHKNNTVIWHELAKHNNIMKKIPSKIWYNCIAKIFFKNTRIIPRSKNAYDFISKYCNNVSKDFIDHGVDLEKFKFCEEKEKYFVVLSQLIKRKRIDGIIEAFYNLNNKDYKLFIIGDGEEKQNLEYLIKKYNIEDRVIFKGFMKHEDAMPIVASATAMLINTEKDNNMVSVVESIALGTPIVITNIPYNSFYIKNNKLGIVTQKIEKDDLLNIIEKNKEYVENCKEYRNKISNEYHVEQFMQEYKLLKSRREE